MACVNPACEPLSVRGLSITGCEGRAAAGACWDGVLRVLTDIHTHLSRLWSCELVKHEHRRLSKRFQHLSLLPAMQVSEIFPLSLALPGDQLPAAASPTPAGAVGKRKEFPGERSSGRAGAGGHSCPVPFVPLPLPLFLLLLSPLLLFFLERNALF